MLTSQAMVFVTKVLKKTAGEDNSKTEMCAAISIIYDYVAKLGSIGS